MIAHYLWNTPNGYKTAIALEEMGIAHQNFWVSLSEGEQFHDNYTAISPNNRIPAIVDPDGPEGALTLMESGAILQYLARKTGQFYGETELDRINVDQWLHWQMGGIGPMFGQAAHFINNAPDNTYSITRYLKEMHRLLDVLERQLKSHEYVAGEYSIADMAIFPWVRIADKLEDGALAQHPNIQNWLSKIHARQAVIAVLALKPEQ